ncbi:DNA repair protein RAD51 homolog 4 isoform X2 [Beta vulgaris subsp. vulgaris]|uniref:DNA repair protein RAD51 homolog 4 isoform X2 n=1 Tax=Beta vulgaris subsp. vulgaris TaxID=3555 RepID=UPI0020371BAF|nr:DNA repair protein RAD51 homolog 4 isoform X2 [Beta vulgaris subsp. vulgaris]
MGFLKSMEDKYPLLDSIFQEFCGSRGIYTVEDFLIHDLNALILSAEKKPTSERLKQGIDQLLSIVNGIHKPWLNGVELLNDAQQNKQTLSLAYEGIDPFLHGALREGFVTELVGPSSSGKTQVCLQAAASVAKRYADRVAYIDSGNSFSAPRIAHLVKRASYSAPKQDNNEALHIIMKNIWCYPVFDIFSLFDVLHQLELKLKSQVCVVNLCLQNTENIKILCVGYAVKILDLLLDIFSAAAHCGLFFISHYSSSWRQWSLWTRSNDFCWKFAKEDSA